MDKLKEIMKAVDNFNVLIADVEQATKDNNKIVNDLVPEQYLEWCDKIEPYSDIVKKLDTKITIKLPIGIIGTHITFDKDEIWLQPSSACCCFKVHRNAYFYPDQKLKIINTLNEMFSDEWFGHFENEFYNKVQKAMDSKAKKVDEAYRNSCDLKNQFTK